MATLSTSDGIVFELAWFAATEWPGELARVAVLPEDFTLRTSQVPAGLDLPYDLLDAASEAVASGRPDLLPVLATRASGGVSDVEGATVGDAEIALTTGAGTLERRSPACESVEYFWHFVDAVWVLLFLTLFVLR